MRIYFESYYKHGKKTKKTRPKRGTSSVSPDLARSKRGTSSVSPNVAYAKRGTSSVSPDVARTKLGTSYASKTVSSTKKVRSNSATSPTKISPEYRPQDHHVKLVTETKPPVRPKIAFQKREERQYTYTVNNNGTEECSASLTTKPKTSTRPTSSDSAGNHGYHRPTKSSYIKSTSRYTTCFSPLYDIHLIETEECIKVNKGSYPTDCNYSRNYQTSDSERITDVLEEAGRSYRRQPLNDPSRYSVNIERGISDTCTSEFYINSPLDETSEKSTAEPAVNASKEINTGLTTVRNNKDIGTCSTTVRNGSTSVRNTKDISTGSTTVCNSVCTTTATDTESVTYVKLLEKPLHLSGVWNTFTQGSTSTQNPDKRLTRGAVIEQSIKTRSVGDILSNINVYLPSLQTKINKIQKDYSRLDNCLSEARKKIQNHRYTPNSDKAGIVAWA